MRTTPTSPASPPTLALVALALAACVSTPTPADAPGAPDPDVAATPVAALTLEGDLDGDGVAERVTAYLGRSGQRGLFTVEDDGRTWTSAIFPIWSAHLADLDGDGRLEVVAGSLSRTPRPGQPGLHRALWVMAWDGARLVPLWRASALGRPLRDLTVGDLDGDGLAEVVALEEGERSCVLTAYRWHGFGVVALARRFEPCGGLSIAHGLGEDAGPVVIVTERGRRRVGLAARELVLDAPD